MNTSGETQSACNVLLVGDTTLDTFARFLERNQQEPRLKACAAPFGQVYQILLDASHPTWSEKPEILVVWTAAEFTLPSFARLLRFECDSITDLEQQLFIEVDQFANAVLHAATRIATVLVPTWILPTYERWIQTLACRHGIGTTNLLAKCNLRLAERFAGQQNIILLDAANWQASLNRPAFDPRMFAFGKVLYSQPMFEKAAIEIKAILRGILGQTRKVIVCDLDNTLWGGVLGDDGAQNIKIGAPDPVGECFQTFQRSLKRMRSRGILLAICSKNEEELALSVIDDHPSMVLRKNDFAGWRINWKDKAENLVSLAEELNVGLDSFVFLDDSPQERDQVRQILPQVYTPELPPSPSEYSAMLLGLDCFETASLGKEDFERTDMYRAERDRKESVDMAGDLEGWLRSLKIEVRAAPLRPETLPRAAQLLNKTNQFNLSLRRLDEKSLWNWTSEPNKETYTFHISDRFGEFGLAALTSVEVQGNQARIVDFVMSCRVMGKKVEEAVLGYTVAHAQARGVDHVIAPLIDGPRNQPARGFFSAKFIQNEEPRIDPKRVSVPPEITLKDEN
jgi:FkbH-like protein